MFSRGATLALLVIGAVVLLLHGPHLRGEERPTKYIFDIEDDWTIVFVDGDSLVYVKWDKLPANYRQALTLRHHSYDFSNLGLYRQAIWFLEAANKAAPNEPRILNELAWLLATSADEHVRDPKRAVLLAKGNSELARESGLKDPHIYHDTLAAAYAASGKFDDAILLQNRALTTVPDEEKEHYLEHLSLFRAKKPVVDEPPTFVVPIPDSVYKSNPRAISVYCHIAMQKIASGETRAKDPRYRWTRDELDNNILHAFFSRDDLTGTAKKLLEWEWERFVNLGEEKYRQLPLPYIVRLSDKEFLSTGFAQRKWEEFGAKYPEIVEQIGDDEGSLYMKEKLLSDFTLSFQAEKFDRRQALKDVAFHKTDEGRKSRIEQRQRMIEMYSSRDDYSPSAEFAQDFARTLRALKEIGDVIPNVELPKAEDLCPTCRGSGKQFGNCSWCEGRGKRVLEIGKCARCNGTGRHNEKCPTCFGSGRIR